MNNLFIEKYRPSKFEDVVGQEIIVERVKAMTEQENIPHMLFSGPPGTGKCVSQNTLILDGDGNLIPIEEAYKKKIKSVMGLGIDGKIRKQEISYFYKGYSEKTYLIKTKFGGELIVTPEHPFLALKEGRVEWIKAENLKNGFRIASPLELEKNFIGESKLKIPENFIKEKHNYSYHSKYHKNSCKIKIPKLDQKFYYWLGLTFGDGNFRSAGIRFFNEDDKMREKFTKLSYEIFGNKIEIKDIKPDNKCPYAEIRKATTIIKLLESNLDHKICGKKSDVIKVPKELFTMEIKKMSSFIRGLYETDGSSYKSYVEISSNSKQLIVGLRYLFLNLGICSRIKKKRIVISGSFELNKFIKKIKPTIKIPIGLKKNNTNIDILTINKSDVRFLLKTFGISYNEAGHKFVDIIEKGKGNRLRVQRFYKRLAKIVKSRFEEGIEAIYFLDSLNFQKIDSKEIFEFLKEKETRNKIGVMRSDRLKEYYNGRRTPHLKNYLKIMKKLCEARLYSEDEYKNLIRIIYSKKRITPILRKFGIDYKQISKISGMNAATTNNIINKNGLALESINYLGSLFLNIKAILESKIFNEKAFYILEQIGFLEKAKLIWDCIKEVSLKDGGVVYDLNVKDVHNFIGGNSPLVLHNTTIALIIAKTLFKDNWKENFLETNASSDRGIDVIREQVKNFAKTRPIGSNLPKIIFLDEADALTRDAQNALRRTMEQYSENARFILSANYSSKIIDPIQSRCTAFRFKLLNNNDIKKIINKIVKNEKLKMDDKTIDILYNVSEGDVRRAENILQSCSSISNNITEKLILDIVASANPKEIKEVLEYCVKNNFIKARDKLLEIMLKQGLSGLDIIKQIQKEILELNINENKKLDFIDKCGEIEFRMVEGSDEFIQLQSLMAFMSKK